MDTLTRSRSHVLSKTQDELGEKCFGRYRGLNRKSASDPNLTGRSGANEDCAAMDAKDYGRSAKTFWELDEKLVHQKFESWDHTVFDNW